MAHILMKQAPMFCTTAVICKEFKEISLKDYNDKYLVLFFYPMDFTRVCTSEIIALSDRLEEFKQRWCEIVGVSCDSHFTHLAWIQNLIKERNLVDINIPLLTDKTGKIARGYGVYNEEEGISSRAFFIIDRQQLVREVCINDRPVARSVEELLRLIDAIQFADEHVQDVTAIHSNRELKRRMLDQDNDEVLLKSCKTADKTVAVKEH